MRKRRLWPIGAYVAVCLLAWLVSGFPGTHREEWQGWYGGLLLGLTGVPWIFTIDSVFRFVSENKWVPRVLVEVIPFLIPQLVNAIVIFMATGLRNEHAPPNE